MSLHQKQQMYRLVAGTHCQWIHTKLKLQTYIQAIAVIDSEHPISMTLHYASYLIEHNIATGTKELYVCLCIRLFKIFRGPFPFYRSWID